MWGSEQDPWWNPQPQPKSARQNPSALPLQYRTSHGCVLPGGFVMRAGLCYPFTSLFHFWGPSQHPGCIPGSAKSQAHPSTAPPAVAASCLQFFAHQASNRHFKHFLNYVVVSTSLKMGLWYTIKGEMYKLSDVVSICSSMWNYTRNRRLLSEKSIFLSFLWLC